MVKQRYNRIKKILYISMVIFFVISLTATTAYGERLKERTPVVSFVFDDSYMGQTGVLDEKGVHGTIAFVTSWEMDLDKMHALENNGWEIASHSVTHDKLSESEYKDSRDYLISQGFDVVGFVTPFGGASSQQDKWVHKYYRWGRDVETYPPGYIYYYQLCNYPYPRIDTYHLKGAETAGHSLDELKKVVDAVENNDFWVIWMLHGEDMTDEDLSALIDYTQAKNIDILPVNEALKIYGNPDYVNGHKGAD